MNRFSPIMLNGYQFQTFINVRFQKKKVVFDFQNVMFFLQFSIFVIFIILMLQFSSSLVFYQFRVIPPVSVQTKGRNSRRESVEIETKVNTPSADKLEAMEQQRRASMQMRRASLAEVIPDWPMLQKRVVVKEVHTTRSKLVDVINVPE